MTCFLRDRDQPGAIDGGLCIPEGVPNIASFCSELTHSKASQVSPLSLANDYCFQNYVISAAAT